MSYRRPPPTPDAKTFELAKKLSALETGEDIDVYAPKVIAIMRGAENHRFWAIDERESYWRGLNGRFWMLRSVRNHSAWGPRLFRALDPGAAEEQQPAA
jgi:hypothetical protein